MSARSLIIAASIGLFPIGALADGHEDPVIALYAAMGMPEMIEVMHEEGIEYGTSIAEDLFPGRSNTDWAQMVERIYNIDRMKAEVIGAMTAELEGDDVASMLSFFTSEPGQTIIELEIAARRALLDDDVEEAAKEVAALAIAEETPRYQQIEVFVDTNDLVETNIVGAMNSNFAFYSGLLDGGAFPAELTEEQILTDVWGQEPEIRKSTTEWVYSFLMLAYEPLEEGDIDTYIAFSDTDPGQELNSALFVAFDSMFENISRNLGLASAQFMIQQEL